MKALLLIENDATADIAKFYLKPLGFEAIRYRNPLKALDNLGEIEPDAIILSAADYPRHWKVIASAVRAGKSKEECVLILLKGKLFPFEEAAKAAYLGVNGVVQDDLADAREQQRFQRLLKRYVSVEESRVEERLAPAPWDRLDFMFSHPETLAPIAGKVENVSATGLSFLPDSPAMTADIAKGTVLEDCSLRVGDRILSLSCRVARADKIMGLAITAMEAEERAFYEAYLENCPRREIEALLKNGPQ